MRIAWMGAVASLLALLAIVAVALIAGRDRLPEPEPGSRRAVEELPAGNYASRDARAPQAASMAAASVRLALMASRPRNAAGPESMKRRHERRWCFIGDMSGFLGVIAYRFSYPKLFTPVIHRSAFLKQNHSHLGREFASLYNDV